MSAQSFGYCPNSGPFVLIQRLAVLISLDRYQGEAASNPLHELFVRDLADRNHPLLCPSCGQPMVHDHTVWRWPGDDIEVFWCQSCRVGVSEAAKLPERSTDQI